MKQKISIKKKILSWCEVIKIYSHPKAINLFFLGFSAGLPLLLLFSTLSFWLREAGVDRSTIGYFSWIGLAYSIKWLWSPLVDNFSIPILYKILGRRRSWLLISQIMIIIGIVGIAFTDPRFSLNHIALFAVLIAFSSATQDIVIDAYRIEVAEDRLQAVLAATYIFGYRVAMIISGAGTLLIASWASDSEAYQLSAWHFAYVCMAFFMLIGVLTTLCSKEPKVDTSKYLKHENTYGRFQELLNWIYNAILFPFIEFFRRYGWHAIIILILISLFRISDIVLGVMANPFYIDLGFTKQEVASVSKIFGVIMTLIGVAIGGSLTVKFGIIRIMLVGAILTATTNLLFLLLNSVGHDLTWLTVVISFDNLAAGIATSTFVAWMSRLVNLKFSATQYALLSSTSLFFPKFIAGFSGVFVDTYGYYIFFWVTAILGIPSIFLIWHAKKWMPKE